MPLNRVPSTSLLGHRSNGRSGCNSKRDHRGRGCALALGLNLPMGLRRGEALSVVTGFCNLGDVTIQTDQGDWRFAGAR
jgi:hypothetical protein